MNSTRPAVQGTDSPSDSSPSALVDNGSANRSRSASLAAEKTNIIATPELPLSQPRSRLGFLGVGWIGRNRLEAIARSGTAEVAAIADTSPQLAAQAQQSAPDAFVADNLEDLLTAGLDGVVIATPSALHAEQTLKALNHGLPVFCQKPLARTAQETRQVIQAARENDLLLGVDLSYRFLSGVQGIRELCRQGELGEIFAVELAFHNAYGPDKPWFYNRSLSGGGCLIDLGTHLVDLALWCLGNPRVLKSTGRLFTRGKPLPTADPTVEDYAVARLDLEGGTIVHLACSWKLPAGCDAIISGCFYGSKAGAGFRNVNGSFYEFVAEKFEGTRRVLLRTGPEDWGGRAAVDWAQRLARSPEFDPAIEGVHEAAQVLDSIYLSHAQNREIEIQREAAGLGVSD